VPIAGLINASVWTLALAFLGSSCGIIAWAGWSSWARTTNLRKGQVGGFHPAPGPPPAGRTSPVTYAPATAGVAITWMGYVAAASGAGPLLVFALSIAGATVAISGLAGRVTAIMVVPGGLVVRYAGRHAYTIAWGECASVRPPRWPLGGWRIERTDGAARILMPSDMHGLDWVVPAAVRRAGLRFEGGRWRR
jgi:hypothetical protein